MNSKNTTGRIAALMLAVLLAAAMLPAQTMGEAGALNKAMPKPTQVAPAMPQVPQTQTQTTGAQATPPAQQAAPAQPVPPAEAEAQPENTEASVPLHVMVDKSLLITTADRIRRVSVTDPTVADALVVTPTQILVHGRAPGEVSLIVWNEAEQSRSFDLRVDVDITTASNEIHRLMPGQIINITASRNAMVLTGHVADKETADRAALIASAYSKNVVNALTFGPVGADEVLLEVKFAEVDRTALAQYGVNLFSTGAANTFGSSQTGQFGPFSGAKVGAVTNDVQLNGSVNGNNAATGEVGGPLFHQPASFGTNDLMNIFLFRSDLNLGAIIKALQQKNVLEILAEPNLIAVNGKAASFLAGGEFPYPVSQGISGAVTIQFREFGVRLTFTPLITPSGAIHLQVAPEVSVLDFANGVTINGFTVPGLDTRRAQTELEMNDGQSFVIAGLLDNRVNNVTNKVAGLGDLPILGTFFKSKNLQKSKTELLVLVTAHRMGPSSTPAPLPKFPEPFMDQKRPAAAKPGGR